MRLRVALLVLLWTAAVTAAVVDGPLSNSLDPGSSLADAAVRETVDSNVAEYDGAAESDAMSSQLPLSATASPGEVATYLIESGGEVSLDVTQACRPRSAPDAAKLTPAFKAKVQQISTALGIPNPNFLLACMGFETGLSFCSSVRNTASGATGLIQFMPSTARGLGTTTDALARMTELQQLDYVQRYFQPYRNRLRTIEDVYMAILWPAAVGKENSYALFRRPTTTYNQNRGLDINNDGVVTKQEAAAKVMSVYHTLQYSGHLIGGTGAPINAAGTPAPAPAAPASPTQRTAANQGTPAPAPASPQASDPRDAPCAALQGTCVHISTCTGPKTVVRLKCGGPVDRICCVPPRGAWNTIAAWGRTAWNTATNAAGTAVDRVRAAATQQTGKLEAGMVGPIRYFDAYDNGRKVGSRPCVKIQGQDGSQWVDMTTASAFIKMNNAYRAAKGRNIRIVSGFRTNEKQTELYNGYVARRPGYNLAARPGYSNHQDGKALDLGVSGDSQLYAWLKTNAQGFGFVRTVPSENWHWEYRPGAPRASYT